MHAQSPITLAVDPTTRGYAFGVLNGSRRLLDFGTSRIKDPLRIVHRIASVIDRHRVALLVLEDVEQSRRGKQARTVIDMLHADAVAEGLPVLTVPRLAVQRCFAHTGTTKYEIAVAIAERFPELSFRLPRQRKPWMTEDERMNIFDAVSFAIAVLTELEELP